MAGVAGCDLAPDYTPPRFAFKSGYDGVTRAVPVLLEDRAWWREFDDPALTGLIATGLSGNLDIALARERVREARAGLTGVAPNATVTPSFAAETGGEFDAGAVTTTESALGFSWMLDPYGQRAARLRAAAARVEVADARTDAARLVLLSELAGAYLDLRFSQRALGLRRGQLASRRETVRIVRTLMENGAATRLDLIRTEALVAETEALIPPLEADIRAGRNRIAVLLGQQPGRLDPDPGSGAQPVPDMVPETGVPADLLRNRPDLLVRERLYYAAIEDIADARADLYPRLFLSGTLTLDSIDDATRASYLFGPSIRFPALPNSPRRGEVKARESRARQAHTEWTRTVLTAVEEVESAQASYGASRRAAEAAGRTAAAYRESLRLTKTLVREGGATIRDLIEAEQRIAEADITRARTLRDVGRDFVRLNVALGAGKDGMIAARSADSGNAG